jgi:hypothetical protein
MLHNVRREPPAYKSNPNSKRLPWRYRMTLCIAAACREGNRHRIVIGADQRIETYMAGADIQGKLYWIDDECRQEIACLIVLLAELP